MPPSATTAAPYIVTKPSIKIGPTGSEVSVECAATNFEHSIDQDENTTDTFCGSYTSFGPQKHTLTMTIAQSYGAAGSWTLLQPMVGTVQPFVVTPGIGAVSVDNPVMSGSAVVKALPFMNAGPGEVSEVDLELAVQGQPAFGIVAPTMAATETS